MVQEVLVHGGRVDHVGKNGWTPLHVAANNNALSVAKLLIEHKAKKDVGDHERNCPIHIACRLGHFEIAEALIEAGADVNCQNDRGDTPLVEAIRNARHNCQQLLLQNDASVHCTSAALEAAVASRSTTAVELLMQYGADLNHALDSLMHAAVAGDCPDIIDLLHRGGLGVDVSDSRGYTPLHHAVRLGHPSCVTSLLDAGADIDARTEEDRDTPLTLALTLGMRHIARILTERDVDVDKCAKNNLTPLHLAVDKGFADVVEILLNLGARVDDALHHAVKKRNLDVLKVFLNHDFARTHRCEDRVEVDLQGLLLLAIQDGSAAVAIELLQSGADVNATFADGDTPLMVAIKEEMWDVIPHLVRGGADVNAANHHLLRALHFAVSKSNAEIVQYLCANGADVKVRRDDGGTLLHAAFCDHDNTDIVTLILASGLDVDATDVNGRTALHVAAYHGRAEAANVLLQNGADVNAIDRRGNTPLHLVAWGLGGLEDLSPDGIARQNQFLVIAQALILEGVNVDATDEDQQTALHICRSRNCPRLANLLHGPQSAAEAMTDAIRGGDLEAVRTLLADATVMTGNSARSVLRSAAESGNVEMVKVILESLIMHDEVDLSSYLHAPDAHEGNLLHWAAGRGHLDVVELLLNLGCTPEQTDEDGNTAVHLAASNGHKRAVDLLLQYNYLQGLSSATGDVINSLNRKMQTPLMVAILMGHEDVALGLMEAGADVNKANDGGDTPLMKAVLRHLPNVVRRLIKRGADVNATNDDSCTALHCAVTDNNVEMLGYLIANGADINARLRDGGTLLHLASTLENVDIITCLLNSRLEVDSVDAEGKTPLHLVCRKGCSEIVDVFIQHGASVNAKDESKFSPLHHLVFGMSESNSEADDGHDEQIRDGFLLAAKSLIFNDGDINAMDNKQQKALNYALDLGYANLVNVLLNN